MALRYPTAIGVLAAGASTTVNLTDHGRGPVQEEREERSVEVELADGTIRKYIKGIKHTWQMDWDWLPDQDSDTVDGYAGRESMRALFSTSTSGTVFALYFRDRAESGGTTVRTYNAYVTSYNDELIRRDTTSGKYFFKCSISFKEQ